MIYEISIVIPCYNEEKNIEKTIASIQKNLDKKINYEIIIIDDGSLDKTVAIVEKILTKKIKIIKFRKNKGKGAALKAGLLFARGNLCLYTDADSSTSISHIFKFIEEINNGYDIVIASRNLEKSKIIIRQPYYKELLGKIGNFLIRKTLKLRYSDTQCGFKLIKKEAVDFLIPNIESCGWSFDFEFLKLAEIYNYKIKELPVSWKNQKHSSVKFFDYFKTLLALYDINKRNKIKNK